MIREASVCPRSTEVAAWLALLQPKQILKPREVPRLRRLRIPKPLAKEPQQRVALLKQLLMRKSLRRLRKRERRERLRKKPKRGPG